jgi:hypothetical protein
MPWLLRLLLARVLLAVDCATATLGLASIASGHAVLGCAAIAGAILAAVLAAVLVYPGLRRRYARGRRCR